MRRLLCVRILDLIGVCVVLACVATIHAGEKTITNSIGMKMVLIPAGEFMMGSAASEGDSDEHPQHRVRITKPFYFKHPPQCQIDFASGTTIEA